MNLSKRKDIVFIILAGFFITNAIVAELIGGKLVQFFGLFTQSIGIILWPVVFLLTDIINEYYGKSGVRKLTYITVGLIIYTYILITIGINMQATNFSPVSDDAFKTVFGQSQWIIIGSIIAFLFSQLQVILSAGCVSGAKQRSFFIFIVLELLQPTTLAACGFPV